MFCPHCGKKNDGTPLQCASCKKSIPPLGTGGAAGSIAQQQQRPGRPGKGVQERFSSVGDRMLALVLDRAVILAFLLIGAAAIADQWRSFGPRMPSPAFSGFLAALALVFSIFLYHLVFEAGFGTTLGKAVMGLQVIGDGERSRFIAVAIRNALRVVDGLGLYVVGFLIATFSRTRQRFGDSVAGTVVLDMPMSKGTRAAMMFLWVALIGVAIGIAAAICPTCRPG